MVSFGPFQESELIILLIILPILFGLGKLPQLARALGESVREFRKAMSIVMSVEYESNSESIKKKKNSWTHVS